MAETVKVEIGITATDGTASGVSSAQRRLNSLDKSLQKTQKQLDKLGKDRCKIDIDADDSASAKLARVDDAVQKTGGESATVDVEANDSASEVLGSVDDSVSELDGQDANVDLGADDAASGPIADVSDGVAELNGEEAVVDLSADDSASEVIGDVSDGVAELDGDSATVQIDADDAATPIFHDVDDSMSELNGKTATIEIQAEDAASGVIDEVQQKASSLDGTVINMSVQAAGNTAENVKNIGMSEVGKAAGVMGATFGVYDSVSTFADFEQGMSQVAAISGATGTELDQLTAKAKYMGATTKFTATESAEAFNYMAMAGWKTSDMLNGIEGIMNLAAASGESLGTTSDIVTDALTAFNMKASDSTHFADVMAQASANANTNVSMLGESFKYVAPVAGAMGYSIEDTAKALGLMANAGVKSSMSGTALRRAITSLAAPTDKQQAAFDKYGISLTTDSGRIKSLNEVMEDLRTNLGGLSEDEKTAAVTAMFGNQAMAGMLAIINASDQDWNKLSDAVNNADGASKQMSDTMLDNLSGSFTLMQSAIEGVEDELGLKLSPVFRTLADSITAAMPDATKAIDDMFGGLEEKVNNMTFSKEWTEADFFGKIDIAWETLIAEPFMDWVNTEGALDIADGLGTLFSNAFKILPGGEAPGLSGWLSAGAIAIGTSKIADFIGKVGDLSSKMSALGEAGTVLGTFGSIVGGAIPWIVGGAAAILALKTAIDAYNETQIKADLEAHFGDINLNQEELEAISSQILELDWKANITLALNELRNADQLRSDAKDKLEENDAIEYKARVGVTLTKDDMSAYTTNVETFIADRKKELDGRTFSAKLLVDTTLSTPEGKTLSSAIDSWTLQDNIEMSSLSNQLSTAVENALKDGIINADEEEAISALQDKINAIVDQWKVAQDQAARDMLTDKYGNMSGEELSAGSYKDLVKEMKEQREAAYDTLDQSTEEFYTILHAMDNSGRLKEAGLDYDTLAGQWKQAVQYEKDKEVANDLTFQSNTLNNAYSDENTAWQAGASDRYDNAIGLVRAGNVVGAGMSMVNDNANKGLNSMFDTYMSDQVDDMYSTLQNYMQQFGGKVPEELRTAYMNAINTGALAGSSNELVGMQSLANSIAQDANQSMVDAINSGTYGDAVKEAFVSGNQMAMQDALTELAANGGVDDTTAQQIYQQQLINSIKNGDYGELLQNALEIALAEGTEEPVTMSGLQAEVSDLQVTQDSAENVRQSVQDFMDATSKTEGTEVTYDAGNVVVKMGEGTDTSGIESALQMTSDQLSQYKVEVEGGEVEYKIPEDQILSAQERAAQEIAGESGGEFKIDGGEAYIEYTINEGDTLTSIEQATGIAKEKIAEMNNIEDLNVINAGATIKIPADSITVDTSEISGAAEGESVDVGDVDATATANTDVEAGEVDPSGAYDTASQETQSAFDTAMEVDGTADATLDQTNNADEVYSGVSSDVQGKFNSAIPAHGTVNVTLDWHITNPTASISVGTSGGTATATISSAGMANGGFVDGAMLSLIGEDGPEFVVPVGSKRRNRGVELWAKAGEALGMFDSIPAYADGGLIGGDEDDFLSTPFEKKKETSNNVWEGLFGSDPNNSTPNVLESLLAATGGPQGDNNDTTNGVNVNVSMSPVIQIEGSSMNEQEVFEVMKSRIKELSDDVGYEIGEKLSKIFGNMPLAGEG